MILSCRCPKCGHKMLETRVDPNLEKVICLNCGNSLTHEEVLKLL